MTRESMFYDVLIVGGGVAGMSCALVLGSARKKDYAKDKQIGIIMHQKTSSLERGIFNKRIRDCTWYNRKGNIEEREGSAG